jgi:hypothetical protein
MAKPMTRAEWENWVEKAWATAQESAKEPKEWVGLTDEEIVGLTCECIADGSFNMDCARDFARAIEVKLKEKNHAG